MQQEVLVTKEPQKKFQLKWFNGLDDKQAQQLKDILNHNTIFFDRFLEILDEFERELEGREYSLEDYENPSWAYKQAHINGQKTLIHKIKRLLGDHN